MGIFIPDPSRPHLRYPWDFAREAEAEQALKDYRAARARGDIIRKWKMTMANAEYLNRSGVKPRDLECAHSHLVDQVRVAKADVMGRLESGDRDWARLRAAVDRYIQFQTAADVVSGQTPLDRN